MNNNNTIAALFATVMNNYNNIVTCNIESAINLAEKRKVCYNRNESIIYCFDVLTNYLLTYLLILLRHI